MEAAPAELIGLDEKARTPPKTRVRDGKSARALVQAVVKEDKDCALLRSIVKGLVAGYPPYPSRKNTGRDWSCNLNFMEGEGLMDSSGVPYYGLFNGVEYYAETKTAYQPKHPDHEQWHGKIACRFHNMLKRWAPGFDWNVQNASYQMRLHGKGPCFFDKPDDWRFRSLDSAAILAPKRSASCIDGRLKFLVVRATYSVVELWDLIKDEEAAKSAGWNVSAVKDALVSVAKQTGVPSQSMRPRWDELQDQLRTNDIATSYTQADDLDCAHLLVQEFNGKITELIVTESEVVVNDPLKKKPEHNGFLFQSVDRYENYNQAVVVFFQDIGGGKWHNVRGLATKAAKHLHLSNMFKCRMVDGAFIESGLVLETGTSKNADKLRLMVMDGVTVLPPGTTIKQSKLAGFIEGPMAVDRMLGNHLASNIGRSGSRSISREDGRGEMPTARQVDAQVTKESSIGDGEMTQQYLTLDTLYKEMFRRAVISSDPEAERFRKECKEDGVPEKALKEMEFVRANRVSGYGSPQMRQLTDQQMLPILARLPEDGQQNFLEDFVGGVKGADKVRRYVPREHIPDRDDADAAFENAMIEMGRLPVIASGQNDVIHLHSHLGDAATALEPVGEAMEAGENDPAALDKAYRYVTIMGQHCEAHIGRLSQDQTRKDMAKMFREQLQSLVAFSGKLRGAILNARREAELAADQAEQATALSALDEAKVRSVETQTDLAARKTESSIENQKLKMLGKMRLDQVKTAEDIRQSRAKESAASSNGSKEE